MSQPEPERLYSALVGHPARLKGLRRLTYRCENRCLLLDAIAIDLEDPPTILLHQNGYKLSHGVNTNRSSEGGRARNTSDGDRHWKPRTYYLADSALSWQGSIKSGQSLDCDHVGVATDRAVSVLLTADDFYADWTAGHAEMTVRRDGSRYAVT